MRGILVAAGMMVLLLVAGTFGYVLIEGWPVFDSLYMTVTTLATVGFGEIHPLSTGGRVFTVFLILGGVVSVSYFGTQIISTLVSGELRRILMRRRMDRDLSLLSQHVIVCGYGRMGRRVAQELSGLQVAFVVIDRSAEALDGFALPLGVALQGDATSDEILRRAGIERARALITVLASDADNLLVTMSARLLAEKLFIAARVEDEQNESKMTRAGATRVVSPFAMTGYRLAQSVVRPTVVEFIDVAVGTQHLDLQLEEVRIDARGALAGTRVTAAMLREDYGSILVALKRASGAMVYIPTGEEPLAGGDVLVVLGPPERLRDLERAARGTE